MDEEIYDEEKVINKLQNWKQKITSTCQPENYNEFITIQQLTCRSETRPCEQNKCQYCDNDEKKNSSI